MSVVEKTTVAGIGFGNNFKMKVFLFYFPYLIFSQSKEIVVQIQDSLDFKPVQSAVLYQNGKRIAETDNTGSVRVKVSNVDKLSIIADGYYEKTVFLTNNSTIRLKPIDEILLNELNINEIKLPNSMLEKIYSNYKNRVGYDITSVQTPFNVFAELVVNESDIVRYSGKVMQNMMGKIEIEPEGLKSFRLEKVCNSHDRYTVSDNEKCSYFHFSYDSNMYFLPHTITYYWGDFFNLDIIHTFFKNFSKTPHKNFDTGENYMITFTTSSKIFKNHSNLPFLHVKLLVNKEDLVIVHFNTILDASKKNSIEYDIPYLRRFRYKFTTFEKNIVFEKVNGSYSMILNEHSAEATEISNKNKPVRIVCKKTFLGSSTPPVSTTTPNLSLFMFNP